MDNDLRRELIQKSPITMESLRKLNIGAGILHLVQGMLMLTLGTLLTWERDIYTFYLKFEVMPSTPPVFKVVPNPQVAFTITYLGALLASFLLISAAPT